MRFIEAKINLFFNPIKDDRDIIHDMINKLSGNYNLASLGDDGENGTEIPVDIPRIVGNSKNGHTNLNISLNRASIDISFDNEYNNSIDKCIDYITKRSEEIYNAIEKLFSAKLLFSGITTTVIMDQLEEDPIEMIKRNFSDLKSNKQLYDVSSKFTYIVNDNNFVNVSISNARGIEEVAGGLTRKVNYLSFTLDINDRYAFNELSNYRSSYKELINNINITKVIIDKELVKLVKGEELNL